MFKQHIEGRVNPRDPNIIANLQKRCEENELAPRTIQSILRLAKRYLAFKGMDIDISHALKVQKSRLQQEAPKALTREEAGRLKKEILKHPKAGVYLLGLEAGLRRGEVFGLDVADLDPQLRFAIIRRSYDGPTKNGKARKVPLSSSVVTALRGDIKRAPGRLYARFDPNANLREMCERAKVTEITFHSLRHTFATLALEAGKSPKLVQTTLGHTNLSTTLDIYWSTSNDILELDFLED